jgi:hypothetical protein
MFGFGKKATFVSPYNPEECIAILNGELDHPFEAGFKFFKDRSFVGGASSRRVTIRRPNTFFRSFYPVHLIGWVQSDVAGSRIIGRFRIALPLLMFSAVWLAVMASIMIGDFVAAIEKRDTSLALTAFSILVVGLLILAGQRSKSLNDEARICRFLTETVDARRVD